MGLFLETGSEPRAKDAFRIMAGLVAGWGSALLLAGCGIWTCVGGAGCGDMVYAFAAMVPLGAGAAGIGLASAVRLACWRPWPRQGGEPLAPPELALLGLHPLFGSWCARQGSFCPLSELGHLYVYAGIWAASGVAHFLGTTPLIARQARGPIRPGDPG